jgi:hypothetical protein
MNHDGSCMLAENYLAPNAYLHNECLVLISHYWGGDTTTTTATSTCQTILRKNVIHIHTCCPQ